jgi:hypothetical protein
VLLVLAAAWYFLIRKKAEAIAGQAEPVATDPLAGKPRVPTMN